MKNLVIYLLFAMCCVILLFIGSAANLRAEDWSSFGQGAGRARNTPEKLDSAFTVLWNDTVGSEVTSSPAVADGILVVGGKDGIIRAFRESDGAHLWSFLSGDKVIASPVLYQGRCFVPSTDGKVYCLNLSDGSFIWNFYTGGTELSSPEITNDTLFMGSGFPNNKVIAFSALDKRLIWSQTVEQVAYSSPAIYDNKVFIGCNSGRYYALNQSSGAQLWSYSTGGQTLLSSPLVVGNSVFLLPGGSNLTFYRVDTNPALWAGANWSTTLTDPAPPAGTLLGTKLAASSLMFAGSDVYFTARFDYYLDTNADTLSDQYVLNEYVIAVDPATKSVRWQKPTGTRVTADQNRIPPYGLCPTPAAFLSFDGRPLLAVLSSISSELRIVDAVQGDTLFTAGLDAPCLASPAVANSRIFIATRTGTVTAFQCNTNRAPSPPASGFDPANNAAISSSTPTINWNNGIDPDASDITVTLRYQIRVDNDGEVLNNYDYISTTAAGVTSFMLSAPVPDNTNLVYAIRTIDARGAYSAWSALQSFWVNRSILPPDPPRNLCVTAGNSYVDLFWEHSLSQDVRGYLVSYKPEGNDYGLPVFIGNITNYCISGLTNGVIYTFRVVAEDYDYLQSDAVEISDKPAYPIMLNDTPYPELISAIADAQAGDTIRLGIGTFIIPYTLQIKEGVNIHGYSPHHTILNGTGLDRIFLLTGGLSNTTTITNLTLYGAQIGIDTWGSAAIIKNTIIRGCNIGIFAGSGSNTEIINNTFLGHATAAIYVATSSTNIRNNIIMDNGCGIFCEPIVTPVISYNDICNNNLSDYSGCAAGWGDISRDVVFVDEINKDYREQSDQPTIDMGDPADDWSNEPAPHGGRINIGAYGNTVYAARSGSLRITTTSLSDGESGVYYSVKISTVGGAPPVTWTILAGTVPPGLALNPTTGEITGIIQPGNFGAYNFSVTAVDTANDADSADFTILIHQATSNQLRIATNILADGEEMAPYQATLSAADGFPPYHWNITGGVLPPNLSIDASSGQISGTSSAGSAGIYSFVVELSDADLYTVYKPFTIKINASPIIVKNPNPSAPPTSNQLRIVTNTLADGEEMAPYQATLSAADGFPPYHWNITGGVLPPNLSIDASS
ncbi:MAG: PQQ-binding-like beta-propeller repeat protein, partial [Planctomycetota bacterium]